METTTTEKIREELLRLLQQRYHTTLQLPLIEDVSLHATVLVHRHLHGVVMSSPFACIEFINRSLSCFVHQFLNHSLDSSEISYRSLHSISSVNSLNKFSRLLKGCWMSYSHLTRMPSTLLVVLLILQQELQLMKRPHGVWMKFSYTKTSARFSSSFACHRPLSSRM